MKRTVLLTAAAFVACTASSFAQNPDRPRGEGRGPGGGGAFRMTNPVIAAIDANNDGELSAEEIAKASEALKKLDTNNDGKIDESELRPRPQTPAEFTARMLANDKNSDGKLSKDELPEAFARQFDRWDEDKDGFVTKDELTKAAERRPGPGGPGNRGRRNRDGGN